VAYAASVPSVLVTGAGRGIGHTTALRLAERGWAVYAGVRRPEDAEALRAAAPTLVPVTLDLTDDEQIAALDRVLPARLDAVVNNAGIVVGGPIEGLELADLRHQLEVNLVGQVAVTQAVLPRLRSSRGRIVFVSSVSGRVATPMMGAYSASKYALEAIGDALRIELHPWGIDVVLIEPGVVDTDIWRRAEQTVDETAAAMRPDQRALYGESLRSFRRLVPFIRRGGSSTDRVAAAIERALTTERPRARYLVGPDAKAQVVVQALLRERAWDALRSRLIREPGRR
jgi:NAD(P)-dependent dehydrogenase (short-subunit alcohol dehydrogenase family)